MSDHSAIEWTDASWNPVTGCTEVSPGCDHCYAKTFAERFRGVPGHPYEQGFDVKLWPDRLDVPLRWRRPRRVFVNSMSDLFHDAVPDEFIRQVFAVMGKARRHQFQVLTKRPGRMAALLARGVVADYLGPLGPLPNVWVGTSVEDQRWADIRIPKLLETPAAVRFLSCEPLLGPIDLALDHIEPPPEDNPAFGNVWYLHNRKMSHPCDYGCGGRDVLGPIHWVIVGGESGHGARAMDPTWARSIRDQCVADDVPFFFKQWGGRTPKTGGRELDGRTWDEMPADLEPIAV